MTREIKLIKDRWGNEVLVFDSWQNWEKYYIELRNAGAVPEEAQLWRQNDWDDIVHDLGTDPNYTYAVLIKRGVTKWLLIRELLVRYKKLAKREWELAKEKAKMYLLKGDVAKANYWQGYADAMFKVRADLKCMCKTPRYIVFNQDKPGFVVDRKIRKGWLHLVRRCLLTRFPDGRW